jgi:uncharacterized protein YerC
MQIETERNFSKLVDEATARIDEVIALRLSGGTYAQIAKLTGVSVARIRRICEAEGI